MQKFMFFKGGTAAWVTLLAMAPMLGYLIYLRKFFPSRIEGD